MPTSRVTCGIAILRQLRESKQGGKDEGFKCDLLQKIPLRSKFEDLLNGSEISHGTQIEGSAVGKQQKTMLEMVVLEMLRLMIEVPRVDGLNNNISEGRISGEIW